MAIRLCASPCRQPSQASPRAVEPERARNVPKLLHVASDSPLKIAPGSDGDLLTPTDAPLPQGARLLLTGSWVGSQRA